MPGWSGCAPTAGMEADLLRAGRQPRHREPTPEVQDRGDRLAAERQARAAKAIDGVRDPSWYESSCRVRVIGLHAPIRMLPGIFPQHPCRSGQKNLDRLDGSGEPRQAVSKHGGNVGLYWAATREALSAAEGTRIDGSLPGLLSGILGGLPERGRGKRDERGATGNPRNWQWR